MAKVDTVHIMHEFPMSIINRRGNSRKQLITSNAFPVHRYVIKFPSCVQDYALIRQEREDLQLSVCTVYIVVYCPL